MGFSKDISAGPGDAGAAARDRLLGRLHELGDQLRGTDLHLAAIVADAVGQQGKCFRGTLMLVAGDCLSADPDAVLEAAVACELVHTASLLIDDLPSMDNATLRRGTPAFHVRHGEAAAILGGIGLLTEAIRVIADAAPIPPPLRVDLIRDLAQTSGLRGLCEGQMRDLASHKSAAGIEAEHDLKTGTLFVCGFAMVGRIAGVSADLHHGLAHAGKLLGRCFQCFDDLLDVLATEAQTGKTVGRDVGPDARRGQMAVRSVAGAVHHYHHLRGELDAALADCTLGGTDVDRLIAQVLPHDLQPRLGGEGMPPADRPAEPRAAPA